MGGEHGLRVGGACVAMSHQAQSKATTAAKGKGGVSRDSGSVGGGSSGVLEPADVLELFAVPTEASAEASGGCGDDGDWRSTRSAMEASFARRRVVAPSLFYCT